MARVHSDLGQNDQWIFNSFLSKCAFRENFHGESYRPNYVYCELDELTSANLSPF